MPITTSLTLRGIPYTENEDTSAHVSMKAGGKAAVFITPRNLTELIHACSATKMCGKIPIVLGNGTNTVFSDGGVVRPVVSTLGLASISVDGEYITTDCGSKLSAVAMAAANAGLTGLEFAHGIPGTVGGAVFMNAGAYGGEIKDVLDSVTYFDGEIVTKPAKDLFFGYRETTFSKGGQLILSAVFKLKKGNEAEIKAKMKELAAARREKQPLELPSAGSVFKRPVGSFAGKLIEDAGLKGLTVGGMQVSVKHAGFIVNIGGGTETDFENLVKEVQKRVKENSGVELTPEVRIIKD